MVTAGWGLDAGTQGMHVQLLLSSQEAVDFLLLLITAEKLPGSKMDRSQAKGKEGTTKQR